MEYKKVTMHHGLNCLNKYIFSFCSKTGNVRSGHHSPGVRSFHNRGPAAVKLLSPNQLYVHGTDNIRMSLEPERNGRQMTPNSWRQLLTRYGGTTPASDWWTKPIILKVIWRWTSSQCSCRNNDVTWSHHRVPVTRRADHGLCQRRRRTCRAPGCLGRWSCREAGYTLVACLVHWAEVDLHSARHWHPQDTHWTCPLHAAHLQRMCWGRLGIRQHTDVAADHGAQWYDRARQCTAHTAVGQALPLAACQTAVFFRDPRTHSIMERALNHLWFSDSSLTTTLKYNTMQFSDLLCMSGFGCLPIKLGACPIQGSWT